MPVVELARAKVNLTLRVVGRRADGYHLLDSIAAFADIADRLSFEDADRFAVAITGPFGPEVPGHADNLVAQAALALFRSLEKPVPPVRITLEKNLPVASGLGGGSADAAAALRGLVRLGGLDCSAERLHAVAAGLGADVPVCLRSSASRMSGIGEIVVPISDFQKKYAVLVNPRVAISTIEVFRVFDSSAPAPHDGGCENDVTRAAVALVPLIGEVLGELERQKHIEMAQMSGSGATCFGLFPSAGEAEEAAGRISALHQDWWCRATTLN
jgi:4-diphosphocytidyl-2-C-methyl-D-erythritol kinase